MKILCFSQKKKQEQNIGWHRVCEQIDYYENDFKREMVGRFQKNFYTLTFVHTFKHGDDQ